VLRRSRRHRVRRQPAPVNGIRGASRPPPAPPAPLPWLRIGRGAESAPPREWLVVASTPKSSAPAAAISARISSSGACCLFFFFAPACPP
jgi:hypothetical protein